MQVTQVFTPRPFAPIKLEITIESSTELAALLSLLRSRSCHEGSPTALVPLKRAIEALHNDHLDNTAPTRGDKTITY